MKQVLASTRVIATRQENKARMVRKIGHVWMRPPHCPACIAHSGLSAAKLMPRNRSSLYRTMNTAAHRTATNASTMGYSGEIFERQKRHLPSSRIQPNTGIFSRQVRRVSHEGQRLGGVTTLSPRGSRYTSTFTREPMQG